MKNLTPLLIAAFTVPALGAAPGALAETSPQNRGASTVELVDVDCKAGSSADIEILMNNFYGATATVTITDINGNQHTTSEDVKIMESVVGLTRGQLEQLANTAGEDEGQNVYRQALDRIIAAEAVCAAEKQAQLPALETPVVAAPAVK